MWISTERLISNFPERKFSLPTEANQLKWKMTGVPCTTSRGCNIYQRGVSFLLVPTGVSGNSLVSFYDSKIMKVFSY